MKIIYILAAFALLMFKLLIYLQIIKTPVNSHSRNYAKTNKSQQKGTFIFFSSSINMFMHSTSANGKIYAGTGVYRLA